MSAGRLIPLWLQIISFAAVLFTANHGHASEVTIERGYIARNWDTEEGLPASSVSCLAKTPDGSLWIGTPNGLVQFDGLRFKTFYPGNTPALTDSRISGLLVDRTGVLWIGTQGGGIAQFDGNRFNRVSLGADSPKAAVSGLVEDASGGIWGTLERTAVFRFRDGRPTFYNTNNGLPSAMVWGTTVDDNGGVWVISRWHLMRFDGERWREAAVPADFPRVSAVTPRRAGGLWVACVGQTGPPTGDRGARIFRYQNGRMTEDPLPVPWSQDSRRSITRWLSEDREGRLWCSARGAGIFFRDDKQWQLFSESPSLSQVQVSWLLEDEDSVLWFGMDGAGLYQLRPRAVSVLEPPPGNPPSCFWTVYPARDGSVWGGTDGNGIFRWKEGVMTRFQSSQGLSNEHVNAILEDRAGNIWAGTMGGLFVFRDGRFQPVGGAEKLRLPVFSLKEDRAGQIWVGTRNGLVQIGSKGTNVFGYDQGIPFGPINAIEEDHRGRIWVSIPPYRDGKAPGPVAPYGLFAQSGRRFEHIAHGQWSGEPNIRCLQSDSAGNLWIGTISTGLYRLRDGKFTEYTLDDGLPHNRIQALASDNAGNLWLCSELGVFGCPAQKLENYTRGRNARLNWWQIQRAGGLPNKSATGNGQPSAVRGPDGRIWFANGNALAGFDPKSVIGSARLWPPLIEEVLVNGLPQSPAADGAVRITSETRRVDFHYTSPNTASPGLPTFWIRLKGFDSDWVNAGVTRVASYNLQPGDYEFSVAITGPDGSRIETARPLQVEVVPQFWERRSVRVLAGVAFVAIIVLAVWRWERARSLRRFRQLEIQRAMDQVRQRIARDIHDDLGSGLTEITLLSDNLQADGNDRNTVERTVQRIGARARALTHEMDEVVWAINPRTDTLESLVTYLNDFAQERLALAGIRCRLNTAAELPSLELSADIRHSLYRAAREALNNAIKYAAATEVVITIEARGDHLLFVIQDNGRGFDPGRPLKRGNGLANMRQRLEEIGGRCEIESRAGAGTSIGFTIPRAAHRVFQETHNGHSLKQ